MRSDGKICRIIIQECAKSAELHLSEIDLVNGGGDETPSVLQYELKKKKVTVALLDSDARSPFTPDTKKVVKSREVVAEAISPAVLVVLPCHEIENIVPLPLLESFVSKRNKSVLRRLMKWNKMDKGAQDPFARYHDLCSGLTAAKLALLPPADREWIEGKMVTFSEPIGNLYIPGIGKPLSRLASNPEFIVALRCSISKCERWAITPLADLVWFFVAPIRRVT